MASTENLPPVRRLVPGLGVAGKDFPVNSLHVPALLSPIPSIDEDDKTEADVVSIASTVSCPDSRGFRVHSVTDEPPKTVYEAYEIVKNDDTEEWETWKKFGGMNFGVKYRSLEDGFLVINPLATLEQGELADLVAEAVEKYDAKPKRKKEKKKGNSYAQDLANRVYYLPYSVYDRVASLVNDKTLVTNRNPFRRREWNIVLLEKGEYQMTELLPQRKKKGLFRRKREPPNIRKWFVVIEGKEIKSSKEGWRQYWRHSNPWWRVDKRETRERRYENKAMQEYLDKKDHQLVRRNSQ